MRRVRIERVNRAARGPVSDAIDLSAAAGVSAPRMVAISEGWFWMGSAAGQENERPVHRVWVDAFELAECQLTNGEYARFLAATKHRAPLYWENANFSHPEQPLVAPSWFDAVAYCEWLSAASGLRYRLPTEAEWERAARGGVEQKQFPWGDEAPGHLANYSARWKNGPEPVGRAERNAYGLCDMGANVHEWCADWFSAEYYGGSPKRNPQGPAQGLRRSSRGGSWRHQIKVSRCAARASIPPEFQYADYGLRIARDVQK